MSHPPVTLPRSCTSFFRPAILVIAATSIFIGCGLIDPKFENYENGDTGGSGIVDASTECGQTAVAAFDTNMKSAVDGTCAVAGCHASGAGAAELLMVSGDTEANRIAIFGYTGFDRGKLTAYIGGGVHGGGDKSGDLPVEKVTAWLDVEEQCASTAVANEPGGRPGERPGEGQGRPRG